ncbi:hypothetical protein HWI79_3762, partial [Cryptosporidium felis]
QGADTPHAGRVCGYLPARSQICGQRACRTVFMCAGLFCGCAKSDHRNGPPGRAAGFRPGWDAAKRGGDPAPGPAAWGKRFDPGAPVDRTAVCKRGGFVEPDEPVYAVFQKRRIPGDQPADQQL